MSDPLVPKNCAATGFEDLYARLQQAGEALERGEEVSAERRERILAERARSLARARSTPGEEGLPVLCFRTGGERYAVPVEQVHAVVDARGLASLPGTPREVLGALATRNRVVAVLDLRALLGLEGGGLSDLTKVIVVEDRGERFGLAAEEIEGQLVVPSGQAAPPSGPFLQVTADRLAVLDLARLGAAGPFTH